MPRPREATRSLGYGPHASDPSGGSPGETGTGAGPHASDPSGGSPGGTGTGVGPHASDPSGHSLMNVPVIVVSAVKVTVHDPVPVQLLPVQPVNTEPLSGVAIRINAEPLA